MRDDLKARVVSLRAASALQRAGALREDIAAREAQLKTDPIAESDEILSSSAALLARAQAGEPIGRPLMRSAPEGSVIRKRRDDALVTASASPLADPEASYIELDADAAMVGDALLQVMVTIELELRREFERKLAKLERRIVELERAHAGAKVPNAAVA